MHKYPNFKVIDVGPPTKSLAEVIADPPYLEGSDYDIKSKNKSSLETTIKNINQAFTDMRNHPEYFYKPIIGSGSDMDLIASQYGLKRKLETDEELRNRITNYLNNNKLSIADINREITELLKNSIPVGIDLCTAKVELLLYEEPPRGIMNKLKALKKILFWIFK